MLGVGDGEVGQVAGDGLTGLYRVKDGVLPYRSLEGTGVSVEAYSWGALTSGVQGFFGWVRRVLWLLLLPFALVNLAYWARLELGRGSGQARWGARAVRVSGLLLTVFFVLTPCVVAIDLVAWQCFRYGVPGCSQLPDWLNFLAALDPGQRIAVATVVPMAADRPAVVAVEDVDGRYESVVATPLDKPPAVSLTPDPAAPHAVERHRAHAAAAALPPRRGHRHGDGVHRRAPAARRARPAAERLGRAALGDVRALPGAPAGLRLAVDDHHPNDVEPVAASRRRPARTPVAVDTAVLAAAVGVYVAPPASP